MTFAVQDRQLMIVREAAGRHRVSEKKAHRRIARADLPAVRLGGLRSALQVPTEGRTRASWCAKPGATEDLGW
jgi:hypothetical protein